MLVAGTIGVVTHDQVGITDLVEVMPHSRPNPDKERATELPPVATPADDEKGDYVTYLHLTRPQDAVNILGHGIQPTEGIRSRRGDVRFYTITQERGPYPRPSYEDVADMHSDLTDQFLVDDPTLTTLTLIEIKIPVDIVLSLENSKLIYYQSFYKNPRTKIPVSPPPYTETVFEPTAFPIINQYTPLWESRPMRLK